MTAGPKYLAALAALQKAHDACFHSPHRTDVLSMSYGPFAGVNEALEIVAELESENEMLKVIIERGVQ